MSTAGFESAAQKPESRHSEIAIFSWDKLPACPFRTGPDKLEAYPTSINHNLSARQCLARRSRAVYVALVLCGLSMVGCTRAHYREQADAEVYDAVAGATANPRFEMPGYNIGIDPRSRLFDPTDPDRPPMPPDDPDSHRLMECVDGHRGWPHWHKDGDLADVEVSDYRAWLPYDTDGRVRVDLGGAIELARLHSREYQAQMETLYLSALDVTAERFRFQSQFFGGNATQFTSLGRIRNGGTSSSLLTTDTDLQMRKLSTTGGTLIVGLANSIVWEFSGQDTSVNSSLLNFAISQPLLQFAGRPRVMEILTRSERSLLANVRQFDRYRQGFYLDLATGNAVGSGLSRTGGLFGGSGLSGFTGVGVGGFGGVGAIGVTSSGGFAGSGGVGANGAGGYLFFLQQQQFIRNQRARIAGLRDTWLQLDAAFDAGRLESRFQVDFARQAYYTGQSELLNSLAAYESALDLYKIRLGLPPDVSFDLRDQFFDQFNLIDPELTQLQDAVGDRLEALAASQIEGGAVENDSLVKDLAARVRTFKDGLALDMQVVEDHLPQRRQALVDLARQPDLKENQFDLRALTVEALESRIETLRTEHVRLTVELDALEGLIGGLASDTQLKPAERLRAEKEILTRLSSALLELSLLQARARLHGVTLVPVAVAPETAFQVAMVRRADWMNAKASLVDSWRLIRFNANALRSNLSVNVAGDLGTSGNNPVKFDSANGRLTAGFAIDAPLTRVLERNQFRQSLIDYQQARRSLMLQRDEIHRGLRSRLRQIRLDQFNLELRRLAVDVAITQTDVARLKLVEPEKPTQDGKVAPPSTTIARDLVDALANLQQTQVFFIQVWGDYEIQRRLLDFDLGTMDLDDRGLWSDPGPLTDDTLLGRYYECLPDPFVTMESPDPPGYVELAPAELPPEPTEFKPL
ncbi:MAG: hypothetical protein AABP62_00875 [Planctomycetota bacterium]